MTSKDEQQKTISGIDVMRGVGIDRAKDFWADAWDRVYRASLVSSPAAVLHWLLSNFVFLIFF